jgi:hypothetical protein
LSVSLTAVPVRTSLPNEISDFWSISVVFLITVWRLAIVLISF